MTHRLDVANRHDLAARWCALAEQRLQYLTELFESGRWRRFHSEWDFLQNIEEAKIAVETWRGLSTPASVRGLSAVARPRSIATQTSQRRKIELAPRAPQPIEIPRAAETRLAPAKEAPPAPSMDRPVLERARQLPQTPRLDMANIEQRYPLLRNTL